MNAIPDGRRKEKKDLYRLGLWTGKPDWQEHEWPQIVQTNSGHWYGVGAEWVMRVHSDFKEGETFSLISSECEWLAKGATGDWRNSLERRPSE